VLSRQALPHQQRDAATLAAIGRGGYILADSDGPPECILIATGSEVALALAVQQELTRRGRRVRVVSMPCTSLFDAQDAAWRETVLPRAVRRRVAIEAGSGEGWWRYTGSEGRVIGMTGFGASGPAADLARHFGFTPEAIVKEVESMLATGEA
jgi:transketolase